MRFVIILKVIVYICMLVTSPTLIAT